jgi:hypothetical protein
MSNEIDKKLDKIQETLDRIEARQIAVREEIKEVAPPVVGSFGSSELPPEKNLSF